MVRYPNKKIMQGAAVLMCLAPFNLNAWTIDEYNKTVSAVGAHTGTTGFVAFTEGTHANCQWQSLYFDVSTPLGKSMLALLTTAKTTGQKVRVGYTPPASIATCNLELVVLQ